MSEPITGELRGAMATGARLTEFDGHILDETIWANRAEFENLCDAIDAIHANLERENESLRRELDRVLGEMEERHAWAPESHYMMLPKDADGEYIRIGDVMEGEKIGGGFGEPFEVVGYIMSNGELEPMDEHKCPRKRKYLRHHHAPTVEDVLREFAYGLGVPVADSYIAASAAKLRLAGDAE